ncbi:MAG: hypothetical protein ACRYFS_14990 [Janthinobacterium lividum]
MAEQENIAAQFGRNAQAALQSGTFEEVYKAIEVKLLELDVPGAETPDVADKVNHPLLMAYLHSQTQEARDRAWDSIAARIFYLGSLLPAEVADGAFLADRAQVEELLAKWRKFWADRMLAMIEKDRNGQKRGGNEEDQEDADKGLQPFDGNLLEGLGENLDIFSDYGKSIRQGRVALQEILDERQVEKQQSEPQSSPMEEISAQPVTSQTGSVQPAEGAAENADVDSLELHSIRPASGRPRTLIQQARVLARRVEILPEEDIINLSGYRRNEELGDDSWDLILTASNPKMPPVRIYRALRWWIPNLVYSRLSRLMKLSVLYHSVATHAPAEVEAESFVVVCPYFTGWLSLEKWREMPQDERVEITNFGAFSAHVALELLVETSVDEDTFGYVLPNGTFLRNPSRHCFGPFYLAMAVRGHEQGPFGMELDEPPPQMRWNDYRESIKECNASPSAVAKLLRNLAALTDDDLVSCVRLPDIPHRERVQSILLSRLLRIRKTARNYTKKVHELADAVAEDG